METDRPGLTRPVRRDPSGRDGPTPQQTRGRAWRRSSHGFYVPAEVDGSLPEQRILEASVVAPPGAGVTGWAALRWWSGSRWFTGLDARGSALPVPVTSAAAHVRSQPGIAVSAERAEPHDLRTYHRVVLTRPVCALSHEVRRSSSSLAEAVAAIDMACYSDLTSLAELAAFAEHHRHRPGVRMLRRALELADENSWSPQESRMRLTWMLDAGLPRPRCNAAVFDRTGHHVATPDLIDPVLGLVAEYDGSAHLDARRRLRDVRREDALRRLGLEYVTTLAGDSHGPTGFVARLLRYRTP